MARIEFVHREPDFWDRLSDNRRKLYAIILFTLVKYALSLLALVSLIMIITIISGAILLNDAGGKVMLIFFIILILLAVYSWYKDIKLFKERRRKFGRNWRWYKDSLVIETIIVIALVLIGLWIWSPGISKVFDSNSPVSIASDKEKIALCNQGCFPSKVSALHYEAEKEVLRCFCENHYNSTFDAKNNQWIDSFCIYAGICNQSVPITYYS